MVFGLCLCLCHCLHFWSCCILMLAVANAQLSCNCEHEHGRNLRDTSAAMYLCESVWFSNFELHVSGVHSCRQTQRHTRTHIPHTPAIVSSWNFNFSQTHILVTGASNQLLIAHRYTHTYPTRGSSSSPW